MLNTSARLLKLLALFQLHRDWSGFELAARLGVSARTVRSDIERLRELDYPVHSRRGASGGYWLGPGSRLPPLLLDDEEAVAMAVGLRSATAGGVTGLEEASVRALTKLEQVLPSRLRHRVQALQGSMTVVPGQGDQVDPERLIQVARAIQGTERLRFDYRSHAGGQTRREVEPHRLVAWGRRCYLVAWDVGRAGWRTFRVDRMALRTPNGRRYERRDPPAEDMADYVRRTVGTVTWAFRARVLVHAPEAYVLGRIPSAPTVERLDDERCIVEVGSDDAWQLVHYLGLLDRDFEVLDSPALVAALRRHRDRLSRSIVAASLRSADPPTSQEPG